MHSDSGGARQFRNRHLTSSRGWPALDLPSWLGPQGPEAEPLGSQGRGTARAENVEGSTPGVCQSRKDGGLAWRLDGPAKKAVGPARGLTEADASWPLRPVAVPALCSGALFSTCFLQPEHSLRARCLPSCLHAFIQCSPMYSVY